MNLSRILNSSAIASITKTTAHLARPVRSQSLQEARRHVLHCYKAWQRQLPFLWDFQRQFDIPLPEFRLIIKDQFLKYSHVADARAIDRLCIRAEIELMETKKSYLNPDHVRNVLTRENIEKKAQDFLSRFFAGKD